MAQNAPTSTDRRSQAPESENTPQWRVSPAPDGRGGHTDDKQPLIPRDRWFWYLLGGLLVFNLVVAFATAGAASRQRVPYQPFFVNQLQVAVVKLPVMNDAFHTTPLTVADWGICVGLASVVLWAGELRKLAGRARRQLGVRGSGRRSRSQALTVRSSRT